MTARVAVNHVWMRHFGQPLVESVFDFGLRAPRPAHAELLDYLAAEFMASDWSFRKLHRLIVTSDAYRMTSSTANAPSLSLTTDPSNQFYWRMNARRMESQIIRDSLLQLSGKLDPTMGGPPETAGETSRRRSVYFRHSRDARDKFLSMFDDADLLQCYRRSESIVPQQALALANSKLSMTLAAEIANRIQRTSRPADPSEFARVAIELLLARQSTAEELTACSEFCEQLQSLQRTSGSRVDLNRIRIALIHSLINHNDFISIR